MYEKLKKAYNNILEKWNLLDKKQKIRLISLIIVLILSLAITSFLAIKTEWEVLVNNRSQSEISKIQTALTELGYKNRLTSNGTAIEVEKKYKDQASVDISTKDIPIEGVFTFEDALNLSGMGATELIKKASLRRAKESELAQNMLNFKGISKANVSLAIPESNNYFIKEKEEASASVVVNINKKMDDDQATAMARYISASVVGLDINNVEIIDQNADTIYSGKTKTSSIYSTQDDIVLKRKSEMENRIKALYAPLFDDVKISSNLVFNWDTNKVITKVISPPILDAEIGVIIKENKDVQKIKNYNSNADMGTSSNDNQTPEYQIGQQADSTSDSKNEIIEYAYNQEERITEDSVGKLVSSESSMVIALYKHKEYSQENMEKNKKLEGSTWDDFKLSLQPEILEIDEKLIIAATTGTGIENISIIGYQIPVFLDKVQQPIDYDSIMIYVVLGVLVILLVYGVLKTTKNDEISEVQPELSVDDLLVSSKIDKEKDEKHLEEIEQIKDSESKKQIEKFVLERPEAAAHLMRNWLNEDQGM